MLIVSTALAYTLDAPAWTWQEQPVEASFVLDLGSFPAEVATDAQLEAALTSAQRAFNQGSGAQLEVDATGRWQQLLPIRYVPATGAGGLARNRAELSSDGRTQSCTVEIYGANRDGPIRWYVGEDPADIPSDAYDLTEVLTHEIGHCLGLGHSEDPDALMRPSTPLGSTRRELADDDRAGLVALYGPLDVRLAAAVEAEPGWAPGSVVPVTIDATNEGSIRALGVRPVVDGPALALEVEAQDLEPGESWSWTVEVEVDRAARRDDVIGVGLLTDRGVYFEGAAYTLERGRGCRSAPAGGTGVAWMLAALLARSARRQRAR